MPTEDKVEALITGRLMTAVDIASDLDISLRTTHRVLARLRGQGRVYIAAWAQSAERKYPIPAYLAGKRRDAEKPKRTPAEYQRAWRERRRES